MKKVLGIAFLLCMFSGAVFAQKKTDVLITFPVSFGVYNGSFGSSTNSAYKGNMNYNSVGIGLDVGVKSNRFLFSWENRALFGVSVKLDYGLGPTDLTKLFKDAGVKPFGFCYSGNLLFGAVFTPIENLNINLQSGIGGSFYNYGNSISIGSDGFLTTLAFHLGVPFKVGMEYFFVANKVGISASIVDRVGVNIQRFVDIIGLDKEAVKAVNKDLTSGFGNEVTFNIGIVIKH
ncbi:DUF2715 domain-containing protein [Treponema denticola]|uniref:Outer membrane protein beta-barrel domain-containing protein n=1 Tax=Treponema denticola SP33 TaxID=999437 RepID=M2B520_TREDN|nr:DUF2715 domain-containing protein [Treponema denticola]EMB19967.1 hypothetical protein HMPREF9733_02523 [Treponema denticola SP33]EPF36206.1 hypothetical protein HMPREF9732_01919 [Treponema denticola SP32]